MNILTFDYYERYLDNYKPALDYARTQGDSVRSILLPFWQSLDLKTIVDYHINEFKPDVIITGDILNYPCSQIYSEVNKRVPVVAFQHGISQEWEQLNFNCDYFFCWGEVHREKFSPDRKVIPVGLPKLEQLLWGSDYSKDYILFLGNARGTDEETKKLLIELKTLGYPVVFKPHPEDKFYYDITQTQQYDGVFLKSVDISIPTVDNMAYLIAHARAVVGAGSSAGLKALLLEKPFAVLPSRNCIAYPPSIYCDFNLESVKKAWDNQPDKEFLDRNIGEKPFKSSEIFHKELRKVICLNG